MKLFLGFLFVFLSFGNFVYAVVPAGSIEKVEGHLKIFSNANKLRLDITQIQQPIPFYEGERLESGPQSKCKILLLDKSEILLEENSSFQIKAASMSAENILREQKKFQADLLRGKIRVQIDQKYSTEKGEIFEIRSPNAVAGVRGTIFTLEYVENFKKTFLKVLRGKVHFARPGEKGHDFVEGEESNLSNDNADVLPSEIKT